jgi:hypothetical protein
MPDRDGQMTPEEMFNKMMEEQAKMMTPTRPQGPAMPQGQPGQPPILDANQQMVLNELKNKPPARSTGSHPRQVSSALPQCPDCNMMHPPLKRGERCPNAPASADIADVDMEINKYLVNLKNIAMSQIQSKGIKNINKLLQYMTIEMTKLMEGYNE